VDGAERPVDYDNPQGAIEFSLERGEHLVQILFADTPVRLWSARLSLLVAGPVAAAGDALVGADIPSQSSLNRKMRVLSP
jgi:hypothetical protein